ncbi:MAG: NAD(P)/FAD-dependent oxidoreductase [Pseudomonadota bacterium]
MEQDQSAAAIESFDVVVIGAGPAGSLASALLNKAGIKVLVLEKQKFPRFSIGESLLPQLMVFLEKADMLDAVRAGNFQFKNGAAFRRGSSYTAFNFEQKFSKGPGTTYQVKRADFDKRIADEAERQGVPIRYEQEVLSFDEQDDHVVLSVQDKEGKQYQVKAGFVLDASGFGRVLPRLLDLEVPSDFPLRKAIFCHFKDNITDPAHDRTKILVSVNPVDTSVWYWLIPFSDGTSSFGVVGEAKFFDSVPGDIKAKLLACEQMEPSLAVLLANAEIITEVRELGGYAAKVKTLYGKRFALLGNAGEFLDPVFSSGVTIAFKSADLATSLLIRMRNGEQVDWQTEYAQPLMKGVDTFRAFVGTWYDGTLQDIIFHLDPNDDIRQKLCSILAGYAWDETNPYTDKTERRLRVLAEICKSMR